MLPVDATKWSDRLSFDVALALEGSGESMDEIKKRHGISNKDLRVFSTDPVFRKKVDAYRQEIQDKGLTFRLKARAQAEELLTTSYLMIHSPDVSAAVKADLIKSTVKWADLEPKGAEGVDGPGGSVSININFGDGGAPVSVSAGGSSDTVDGGYIEHTDQV